MPFVLDNKLCHLYLKPKQSTVHICRGSFLVLLSVKETFFPDTIFFRSLHLIYVHTKPILTYVRTYGTGILVRIYTTQFKLYYFHCLYNIGTYSHHVIIFRSIMRIILFKVSLSLNKKT